MEWDQDIDLSRRGMTAQLIIRQALQRGWRVCGFLTNRSVLRLYIPGRAEPVTIYSTSPAQMSYPMVKAAKDKFITNAILRDAGLPVPQEMLIEADASDRPAVEAFIGQHGTVVIKPLDSFHGNGITMNVRSTEDYETALQLARSYSTHRHFVAQKQLAGVDLRVVCIDYQFVDAMSRIPASVTGDGQHSVKELVDIVNQHEDRGQRYTSRLNAIPLDGVEAYIGSQDLQRIPSPDEVVQVIGVSNVGQGGIRKNLGRHIPDELKRLAEKASKTMQLPVCGVDFIVARDPRDDDKLSGLQPHIIEVNECPTLTLYEDLESPQQRKIIDRYLDYVAAY